MSGNRTIQEQVDRTRTQLGFFLIGSFVGALIALTLKNMPNANKDILTYMVGQLSGMATTVLAYYFAKGAGQDAQDAKKAENTAKAFDAIAAAQNVGNIEQKNVKSDEIEKESSWD